MNEESEGRSEGWERVSEGRSEGRSERVSDGRSEGCERTKRMGMASFKNRDQQAHAGVKTSLATSRSAAEGNSTHLNGLAGYNGGIHSTIMLLSAASSTPAAPR